MLTSNKNLFLTILADDDNSLLTVLLTAPEDAPPRLNSVFLIPGPTSVDFRIYSFNLGPSNLKVSGKMKSFTFEQLGAVSSFGPETSFHRSDDGTKYLAFDQGSPCCFS